MADESLPQNYGSYGSGGGPGGGPGGQPQQTLTTLRGVNWRELFPFTNLFRAFRIAVHPSKLLLGLGLLLTLYLGGRFLDWVWPKDKETPVGTYSHGAMFDGAMLDDRTMAGDFDRDEDDKAEVLRDGPFIAFFEHQVEAVGTVARSVLAMNWGGIIGGIGDFLFHGPVTFFRTHPLYASIFTAFFLLVWSIFGGAIARIAAVHVARDEKIALTQSVRFSVSKVLSFVFAPLIPILIIAFLAVLIATGGLLYTIAHAGPIIAGIFFFLALIAGFVIALVVLGTIGGFNLMFPTVAVEGSDSFDAISRSFSYVFARPWKMLLYTLVAVVYGALTYLFVAFFIGLTLWATHASIRMFITGDADQSFREVLPLANAPGDATPDLTPEPNLKADSMSWGEKIGSVITLLWVYPFVSLLGAFAISFYFSANTIIYYLLRRDVDATEMNDVYLEDTEDEFGEQPPLTRTPDATTTAAAEDKGPMSPPAMSTAPAGGAAPPVGASDAPGGGATDTAGSAAPGGGTVRAYNSPATDAPGGTPGGSTPGGGTGTP